MNVLVTGGAGYIGSHVVRALWEAGHIPTIYDDLSTGHKSLADATGAELWVGDVRDGHRLNLCFNQNTIDAVIHCAGKALVPESIQDPMEYWDVNVVGGLRVLAASVAYGIKRFVFSSTAAVYGDADSSPIYETFPLEPFTPYGQSKLAFEYALAGYARAHGIGAVALRYFNVAGASRKGDLGEIHDPETHLVPNLIRAAMARAEASAEHPGSPFKLFGTDYDTRDGTCVRDYVHVEDLADAHVRALQTLSEPGFDVINLGSGEGATVMEIAECVVHDLDLPLDIEKCDRRPGDPAELIASSDKAEHVLGWKAKRTVRDMLVSVFEFEKNRRSA